MGQFISYCESFLFVLGLSGSFCVGLCLPSSRFGSYLITFLGFLANFCSFWLAFIPCQFSSHFRFFWGQFRSPFGLLWVVLGCFWSI